MPKYRKFYIKATESHDINDMPDDFTRLLWVMLPLGLDAEGRGMDNTSWIKAKVMPLREDVTHEMIESAMEWYSNHDMIIRYEVNDRKYFYIPTWHDYQGDTSREAKSNFPEYINGYSRVSQELVKSNSGCNVYDYVYESESEQDDGAIRKLHAAFIEYSGISAFATSDAEIYSDLHQNGVKPEDIRDAVQILQRKKFIIKGPQSVVTTAVNVAKQRTAAPVDARNIPTEEY